MTNPTITADEMSHRAVRLSAERGRLQADELRDREIDHAKATGAFLEPFRFPYALRAYAKGKTNPHAVQRQASKLARYPVTSDAAAAYAEKVLTTDYTDL